MYVCMYVCIFNVMYTCIHVKKHVWTCPFNFFKLQLFTELGLGVLATALVVVGLVTRVMVLGMQKGGLFVSSSPFDLIWLQLLADCDKRPIYQREKGELWMKKFKRNDESVCNVYIMEQSIKMHVISMMPWQAGWESGVWTM